MKKYIVERNGKFIAMFKSLRNAQNYINRRGLKEDEFNTLAIVDESGNEYEF